MWEGDVAKAQQKILIKVILPVFRLDIRQNGKLLLLHINPMCMLAILFQRKSVGNYFFFSSPFLPDRRVMSGDSYMVIVLY